MVQVWRRPDETFSFRTTFETEPPYLAALRNALPRIVAVVEAAERAETYLENSNYLVGAEGVLEELTPALAALEKELQ